MSEQIMINSLEFSRSAKVLRGKIAVADLHRLRDYLHSADGVIEYELSGAVDAEGKSLLHLVIKGNLYLKCQRCLEELEHDVDLVSDLLLIENQQEFPEIIEENEAVDCILSQAEMDVLALLEEDIVLKLPISPRHGTCSVTGHASGEAAQSVFAPLAALKKSAK